MITVLLFASAIAGGHYHAGVGVRGMARAGAFVASADDLSAPSYNVAALSRLNRSQCYMARSWIRQRTVFTPQDYDLPEGSVFTSGERVTPIPSFGCALRTGEGDDVGRLTVAFGLNSPIAPSIRYDPGELNEERTSLFDSLQSHVLVGPYAAYQLTDWLALGIGLFWAPLRIRQSSKATVCYPLDGCGPDTIHVDGLAVLGQAASAGLLLRPGGTSSRWAIGLSGHYTRPMSGNVDVLADSSGLLLPGVLTQKLPLIVRAGVSYDLERWSVEVTAVYEQWSNTLTKFEFDIANFDLPNPDEYVFYDHLEDVWSGRMGGDLRCTDRVTVSGGLAIESSAVKEENWSLDLMGGPRLVIGTGLSVQARPSIRLDLAFAQRYVMRRHITESQITQQVVVPGGLGTPITPPTMGNGEYRVRVPSLGVGVSFAY